MSTVKIIDDKIAILRQEIYRLEIAREVLAEIEKTEETVLPVKTKERTTKKVKAKKPTVAPSTSAARDPALTSPAMRERVKEVLKSTEEPLASSAIAEKLSMEKNKQPVYAALSGMAKLGHVVRNDDGLYSLPQTH